MKRSTPFAKILHAAVVLAAVPCFEASAQSLVEKNFLVEGDGESLLDLKAAAPRTSWAERGSEAAVVTIYIDGRYNQDLTLFAGSRAFTYQVVLGPLTQGEHSLRLELNRRLSAAEANSVKVLGARISIMERSSPDYRAIALSPILYARQNTLGRFSDLPLLMWYESNGTGDMTTLRYSVVFSNEDAGTKTDALMARWGRATDIEWVYEAKVDNYGRILDEGFQGINHALQRFHGKKQAGHPLLSVVSDNNNFSDTGESEMRIALRPVLFDLSQHSREELMDRHPWTYRIMAEELIREGKIAETATALASSLSAGASQPGGQIADPRHYLYLEAGCHQLGTGLSFAVKLKGDPAWYLSDLGIGSFRIDRDGYFRTAVKLPRKIKPDQIEQIVARCDIADDPRKRVQNSSQNPECTITAINKVFLLNDDFVPGPSFLLSHQPIRLRIGEMLEVYRNQRRFNARRARQGLVDGFTRRRRAPYNTPSSLWRAPTKP